MLLLSGENNLQIIERSPVLIVSELLFFLPPFARLLRASLFFLPSLHPNVLTGFVPSVSFV